MKGREWKCLSCDVNVTGHAVGAHARRYHKMIVVEKEGVNSSKKEATPMPKKVKKATTKKSKPVATNNAKPLSGAYFKLNAELRDLLRQMGKIGKRVAQIKVALDNLLAGKRALDKIG